jgi:hypothetical protein
MAQLNIYHVQAKITAYLDLEDYLQSEIADNQGHTQSTIKLETLRKVTKYLLANEDKWLSKDTAILYEIADNFVKNHYSNY